jgi:hypothetical protein
MPYHLPKFLQLLVLLLGCGLGVVVGWVGDFFDSGKGVRDDILLSRGVPNVRRELRNEIEAVEVPR